MSDVTYATADLLIVRSVGLQDLTEIQFPSRVYVSYEEAIQIMEDIVHPSTLATTKIIQMQVMRSNFSEYMDDLHLEKVPSLVWGYCMKPQPDVSEYLMLKYPHLEIVDLEFKVYVHYRH